MIAGHHQRTVIRGTRINRSCWTNIDHCKSKRND